MSIEAPQPALQLRFWGTRGSIPTPIAANLGHGGNTSCIQILDPSDPTTTYIFDAGTGIHSLGHTLAAHNNIHLFLTHFHWDHIQGLLGFAPLFASHNKLTFYSTHGRHELHRVLQSQMSAPCFPVEFDTLASDRHFESLDHTPTTIHNLTIEPFALHHPGGASGYRISRGNTTIVYATDHEHGNPAADARLLAAATNADILIYDAQYTPEQYLHRIGWGHSTWLEATRLAAQANVKQLVLFHHDPNHNDHTLQAILQQAQQNFPNTTLATEGTTL
jgi:phosphoribosyl 1,2-cyclic phosphodiesterase